ncbi:MAG: hypothetical protein J7L30_04600, partial [Methanophagales archaeon]|nr:hypothetical protein [Methanophagales archaeon]
MIAIYNLQAVSATAETKLFLRDGYPRYDVEIRAEMEASRAYETGPAIGIETLEIARGAVIGEQNLILLAPPPHMDELKKEYPEIVK